ncbi:MAG TPA: hypothetical protein P5081_22730 [Phycisphaerae bacterium]|nr:hypothetical protein [Phycisphaerae bacterium]HRW55699.1 hypothetical protein [Phycisphaerae bacterium]
MEIPRLGNLSIDQKSNLCTSAYVSVPCFGGGQCRFILSGFLDDSAQDDFVVAIHNLLALDIDALRDAEPHVRAYRDDIGNLARANRIPRIKPNESIWNHVTFGQEAWVERRSRLDKCVYVSIECGCSWEPEHGLQIVFRNGDAISKVGPCDGHVTNGDAYGRDEFDSIVYVTSGMQ